MRQVVGPRCFHHGGRAASLLAADWANDSAPDGSRTLPLGSCWIQKFMREKDGKGEHNDSRYTRLKDKKSLCYGVPTICLYEVFKKANVASDEAKALQIIAQMKQGRVIDLTEDIALRAALISIKHGLPMAESLILSTAYTHRAMLWTQDEHFKPFKGVSFKEARTGSSTVRAVRRGSRAR